MKKLVIGFILLLACAVGSAIYFADSRATNKAKAAIANVGESALENVGDKAKDVAGDVKNAVVEAVDSVKK